MYADDVLCHIEWPLLFTSPWTGSPDGRVPITAAPTVRAPLRMCALFSVNVYRCKYTEGERDVPLCICLYFCRAGHVCVLVFEDGVRANQRQHELRHQCDIPSKPSSELSPYK